MFRLIGGVTKITVLIKQGQLFTNSNNINFYIKQIISILHKNYIRRLFVQYGYNIIQLSYQIKINNHTLYTKAKKYLNNLDRKIQSKNLDNLEELIGFFIKDIDNNISSYNNIYSGFQDLDILTNGLPYGDLIVIAGRPSTGKTSLAINISYNLIVYFHMYVCFFSLEMSITQILYKLISIGSQISIKDILSGKFNKNQWYRLQNICNNLLKANIYINDNSHITINQIKYLTNLIITAKIKKHVIIIDYLQLIEAKELNIESRNHELGYITRQLKILAQTLSNPIIILSQLNRNIENRMNKQPLLSDLKESGCVNYKIFINIDILNILSITSITKYNYNIHFLYYRGIYQIVKQKNNNTYNYPINIQILHKYNFQCKIYKQRNFIITNHHKLLKNTKWTEQQELNKNQKIIKNNYAKQTYTILIQSITFSNYNLVYDLTKNNYTNFTCNNTIVHNSIEQDADIIIMLANNTSISKNSINSQLVDIIVSKNRNGPQGSFLLYFDTEKNCFSKPISDHTYLQ